MAKPKTWIITVDGSRPLNAVVKDLMAAGLASPQVLAALGTVTGEGDARLAPKLRQVPGVASVEADVAIDLGPEPGSGNVTW
jgi:hypothetical protein